MALVLVTGATGKIGRAVVLSLLSRGDSVRAVVRPGSRRASVLPAKVQKFAWDLASGPLPKPAFSGVHNVVHLAGLVGDYPYRELVAQNAFGTKNLLENCPSHVKTVVLASSVSVYGEYKGQEVDESFAPRCESAYGKSKLLAETFSREYSDIASIVILRFGMVFGPGFEEGYFPVLDYLARGKMPLVGDGSNRIPLIHVDDAVRAILLSLDADTPRLREYNIVGEEKMTQKQLLFLAARELGARPPSKSIPAFVAKASASAQALLSRLFLARAPKISAFNIIQLSLDRAYSIKRAMRELGFNPATSLKNGIRQVVRLFREGKGKER